MKHDSLFVNVQAVGGGASVPSSSSASSSASSSSSDATKNAVAADTTADFTSSSSSSSLSSSASAYLPDSNGDTCSYGSECKLVKAGARADEGGARTSKYDQCKHLTDGVRCGIFSHGMCQGEAGMCRGHKPPPSAGWAGIPKRSTSPKKKAATKAKKKTAPKQSLQPATRATRASKAKNK